MQRLSDYFYPSCQFDEHRRLIVDGKPFFPLGMYFGGISEPDLKTYSASKFNCLMPYEPPELDQMDLAAKYGLKVIYSLKDLYFGSAHCPPAIRSEADEEPLVRTRVRQFRNHRALLAWYLNDELSLQYLPRLEARRRWVAEDDPNHPTWSVVYQVDDISGYINSFDCVGSDPYPIAQRPGVPGGRVDVGNVSPSCPLAADVAGAAGLQLVDLWQKRDRESARPHADIRGRTKHGMAMHL